MVTFRRNKQAQNREIGERIKYLRERVLHMTQEEFAAHFRGQFTRGALGNWERGEGISFPNLRSIAKRFDVSLEWLAADIGEPPSEERGNRSAIHDDNKIVMRDRLDDEVAKGHLSPQAIAKDVLYRPQVAGALPEIDVNVGAGEGTIGGLVIMQGDITGHPVVAEWLLSDEFVDHEARLTRTRSIVLPVVGDSMHPTYCSGDRVIVDLSQRELLQDAVYVISDGFSAPQIKRLQRVFKASPERVTIISDNPSYAAQEHLLADVQIVGRVCGIIARR